MTQMGMFLGILLGLLVISGFFASAETALMRLNRYRMRHLASTGHSAAKRVSSLLERPDRLLSMILIGNTLANVFASSVVTMQSESLYGKTGAAVASVVLTLVILIFAEIMPKTIAALYPEKISYPVSWVLQIMIWVFYPVVWLINGLSNVLLRCLRVSTAAKKIEPLSREELRTIVHEAMGHEAPDRQQMLLRVLDLEKTTINDLMIPRSDMEGIDLDWEWDKILAHIHASVHAWVPVYRGGFDQMQGILPLQAAYRLLLTDGLCKENFMSTVDEAYYVPEHTSLSAQLLNFQAQAKHIGIVVDEYGDVLGLVTLEDILEDIVGDFAIDAQSVTALVQEEADGSFVITGTANIRDLNRQYGWQLPQTGPKTINGLVLEVLEHIPKTKVCCRLGPYAVEITAMQGQCVGQIRLWPDF